MHLPGCYLVTGKKIYADTVASIISKMQEDARPGKNGKGYTWSTFPGIVGDGGTILFLIYAARVYKNPKWKEFALLAGENLLEQRKEDKSGCWYPGVDPSYFGADDNYIDPNFPMGTAGIGFVLMKLYEAGNDPKYLEGNKGIAEFMDSVAVKKGNGKLLPHGLPDRKNLFYLGYCHGPAGTVRYYYKMYEATGDLKYKEKLESLVKGLEAVGAPRIRSEGYWNTYNLCCGTAGILNMYLGLWAAFGDEKYLKQAEKCGKSWQSMAFLNLWMEQIRRNGVLPLTGSLLVRKVLLSDALTVQQVLVWLYYSFIRQKKGSFMLHVFWMIPFLIKEKKNNDLATCSCNDIKC